MQILHMDLEAKTANESIQEMDTAVFPAFQEISAAIYALWYSLNDAMILLQACLKHRNANSH